jgi:hypothetical protein
MRKTRVVLAASAAVWIALAAVAVVVHSARPVMQNCPGPQNARASALLSHLERFRSIHVVEDGGSTYDVEFAPGPAYIRAYRRSSGLGLNRIVRDYVTYERDLLRDPRWVSYPTPRRDRDAPDGDFIWRYMCGATVEANRSGWHIHGYDSDGLSPVTFEDEYPIDVWVGADGCPTRATGHLPPIVDGSEPERTVGYRYGQCDRVNPITAPPDAERRGPGVIRIADVGQHVELIGSAVTATSAMPRASGTDPGSIVVELRLENASAFPLEYLVADGCPFSQRGESGRCPYDPQVPVGWLDSGVPRTAALAPAQTLVVHVLVPLPIPSGGFAIPVQLGADEATVRVPGP